jgi:hypothetical protein
MKIHSYNEWDTLKEIELVKNTQKAKVISVENIFEARPDFLVVSNLLHYEKDIQGFFSGIHKMCHKETRLILIYYSSMWRPLFSIGFKLFRRGKLPNQNWLAHGDIKNLLDLESFELIHLDHKVLMPFYVPIISNFLNQYLAPLPLLKRFCLVNIVVTRALIAESFNKKLEAPSVSIVIPARNESGNIDQIINRIPLMGPNDEIIFIEGHSTDNTWEAIKAVRVRYGSERRILIAQQSGKGKGDAVRKGFGLATNEILMILDADMTVPPEDLPKFYKAITSGKAEFINGSRLVYPMEKEAMRFFNLIGNKFFAIAFSFILGQQFKDTLCGTKVITRDNYLKLSSCRSYFGEFDPFGDFDLIFGASRMGLKIIEVPVSYRERVYGETNISRWSHGCLLVTMLVFAAQRIKFI